GTPLKTAGGPAQRRLGSRPVQRKLAHAQRSHSRRPLGQGGRPREGDLARRSEGRPAARLVGSPAASGTCTRGGPDRRPRDAPVRQIAFVLERDHNVLHVVVFKSLLLPEVLPQLFHLLGTQLLLELLPQPVHLVDGVLRTHFVRAARVMV